ncbi:MAG: hydroxymyristoyl-ACP dehydratase [Candidatus Delongbacteria bacterium]|jgi:3-hydroxyacyl-[acyl-carrier-protein] dehydratase|nr:hydroxymyristoyl-ACP dehydratase [Candidatus Delongbacteria bacterium]
MSKYTSEMSKKIIERLPYLNSFLFVDDISYIDDNKITGHYTFTPETFFYKAHFKHLPVTPGVILIEMMGQIGMVSHLVYIHKLHENKKVFHPILSSVECEFHKEIKVNDKLTIKAKKEYYRKGILKSKIEVYDSSNEFCTTLIAQLQLIIDEQ